MYIGWGVTEWYQSLGYRELDKNEPELTYPYEEMDPLNPLPYASESEPKDAIEVENPIEHEDDTVPTSFHKVGKSSTAPLLREDSDGLLPGLSSMEQGMTTMEKLAEKLGNADDKSTPLTQAAIRRMIKDNVDAAIATERARKTNVRNKASGSRPARG
nr:hypothetical protein [Tanacetum cinerariifolium]